MQADSSEYQHDFDKLWLLRMNTFLELIHNFPRSIFCLLVSGDRGLVNAEGNNQLLHS